MASLPNLVDQPLGRVPHVYVSQALGVLILRVLARVLDWLALARGLKPIVHCEMDIEGLDDIPVIATQPPKDRDVSCTPRVRTGAMTLSSCCVVVFRVNLDSHNNLKT